MHYLSCRLQKNSFRYLVKQYIEGDMCQDKYDTSALSRYTVNSEKIALVSFLRFLAFSLGRKIKILNDYCCHFKCIAGTPCCGQFAKLKTAKIDFL